MVDHDTLITQWNTEKEVQKRIYTNIQRADLIKRGALIKIQKQWEATDTQFFASMDLIYSQINALLTNMDMSFEDRADTLAKLEASTNTLIRNWTAQTDHYADEIKRILYA